MTEKIYQTVSHLIDYLSCENDSSSMLLKSKSFLANMNQISNLEEWIVFLMPLFNNLSNDCLITIDTLLETTSKATFIFIDELLDTFKMLLLCKGEITFNADTLNPTFSLAENMHFYQNKIYQECNIFCEVENVEQKENIIVSISSILESSIYCRNHFGNKYQLLSIDIPEYIHNVLCLSIQNDAMSLLLSICEYKTFYLLNEIKDFLILIDLEAIFFDEIVKKWSSYSKILKYDDKWALLNRWLKETDPKYIDDINYYYQYSGTELRNFIYQTLNCHVDYINLISIPELIIEFAHSKINRNKVSLFDKLVINTNTKIQIDGKSINGLRTDKCMNDFTDNIDNEFITILSLSEELDNKSGYLFYGTNSVHAETIIRNGIDSNYKLQSDFGNHYFYLTPHFKDCVHFANCKSPSDTDPAVLIYKISEESLQQFGDSFHSFENGSMVNGTWEQLVKSSIYSVNNNALLLSEAIKKSCIYGDQVDNRKQIARGDDPKPRMRNNNGTFKQLSVGNNYEWFNEQLVAVILFNK